MAWFRCLVEGENFPLTMDGKPALLGFFATRWVEAANAGEAEQKVVDLIRNDDALAHRRRADVTPMIYVRNITEIAGEETDAPGSGFSFFAMER